MKTNLQSKVLLHIFSASTILMLALATLGGASATTPDTYSVNTTDDINDGACDKTHCSLREAINDANAHPGSDRIEFKIRGSPPFTIQPIAALPEITDPLTIDGTTQLGFRGTPIVVLDGTNAGEEVNGLVLAAGRSTVRGLVINRFSADGIVLTTNGGNSIQGNYIGTDATGKIARSNALRGILVTEGSSNNLIGGTEAEASNLISGNARAGIRLEDTEGNQVQGNFIGTDINGTSPLANDVGVKLEAAANNLIGGVEAGARNIISGNAFYGVFITNEGTMGNIVQGNYIGTDVTGSTATIPAGPDVGEYTLTALPETCPIYPPNTDFDGFVSESDDPLAPWSGTSVHFLGTDDCTGREMLGKASLIYRYRLEFAELTQLTSIAVSGANFTEPNNILRVLDEHMNVLGVAPTFGQNEWATSYINLRGIKGKVFYVDEFDSGTTWRYRQSIVINEAIPLGNHYDGVFISASDNLIAGNLISGNGAFGVEILDSSATENALQGNLIGTDASGTTALPNGTGVLIGLGASDTLIGGVDEGTGNLISGNGGDGVIVADPGTTGNVLQGNFIGTDASGAAVLPNGADGVRILRGASNTLIGGTENGARNLISGNTYTGVSIWDTDTSGNVIQGNTIGTDISGTQPLGNSTEGVSLFTGASDNLIVGNLVSSNGFAGVKIAGPGTAGNQVQGNLIGTDITGMIPLGNIIGVWVTDGAANNLIGGIEDDARNLVSGNLYNVGLGGGGGATGNTVQGNYIGPDRSGSVALADSGVGIIIYENGSDNLIGGTEPGASNLISGNTIWGVLIIGPGVTGNLVQSNLIGMDATGTQPLGNLPGGINISAGAADNLIGGTEPGAGNTVAFNGNTGIALSSDAGSGNALLSNSMFSNGSLGIDLGADGVTPNDPLDVDSGPNDLQNYPVITAVRRVGRSVMIYGTLESTPSTKFRLEFFSNDTCDPSGYGEGQTFLGSADVKTNQKGKWSFIITLPVSLPEGVYLTTTATNPGGSTSEFSACVGR